MKSHGGQCISTHNVVQQLISINTACIRKRLMVIKAHEYKVHQLLGYVKVILGYCQHASKGGLKG